MSGVNPVNRLKGLQWVHIMSFLSPSDAGSFSIAAGKEQLCLKSTDRGQGAGEFADRRRRTYIHDLVNTFELLEDAETKADAGDGEPPVRKNPVIQAVSSALFNHYMTQISDWEAVTVEDKTFFFRLWHEAAPAFHIDQEDWGFGCKPFYLLSAFVISIFLAAKLHFHPSEEDQLAKITFGLTAAASFIYTVFIYLRRDYKARQKLPVFEHIHEFSSVVSLAQYHFDIVVQIRFIAVGN